MKTPIITLTDEQRQTLEAIIGSGKSEHRIHLREVIFDKNDSKKIKELKITLPDGGKFDLKKTYQVVTNSYAAAIANSPRKDQGRDLNRTTASVIQAYLEHQGTLDYTGVSRVTQSVSAK